MSEIIDELIETYRFFVINPSHTSGVDYSMWIREDGYEYPVINSNTGGFTTFNSRTEHQEDGIKPTEEFFEVLGTCYHEAQLFGPSDYLRFKFPKEAYQIYDHQHREFELYFADVLIQQFINTDDVVPELEPLYEWVSEYDSE